MGVAGRNFPRQQPPAFDLGNQSEGNICFLKPSCLFGYSFFFRNGSGSISIYIIFCYSIITK